MPNPIGQPTSSDIPSSVTKGTEAAKGSGKSSSPAPSKPSAPAPSGPAGSPIGGYVPVYKPVPTPEGGFKPGEPTQVLAGFQQGESYIPAVAATTSTGEFKPQSVTTTSVNALSGGGSVSYAVGPQGQRVQTIMNAAGTPTTVRSLSASGQEETSRAVMQQQQAQTQAQITKQQSINPQAVSSQQQSRQIYAAGTPQALVFTPMTKEYGKQGFSYLSPGGQEAQAIMKREAAIGKKVIEYAQKPIDIIEKYSNKAGAFASNKINVTYADQTSSLSPAAQAAYTKLTSNVQTGISQGIPNVVYVAASTNPITGIPLATSFIARGGKDIFTAVSDTTLSTPQRIGLGVAGVAMIAPFAFGAAKGLVGAGVKGAETQAGRLARLQEAVDTGKMYANYNKDLLAAKKYILDNPEEGMLFASKEELMQRVKELGQKFPTNPVGEARTKNMLISIAKEQAKTVGALEQINVAARNKGLIVPSATQQVIKESVTTGKGVGSILTGTQAVGQINMLTNLGLTKQQAVDIVAEGIYTSKKSQFVSPLERVIPRADASGRLILNEEGKIIYDKVKLKEMKLTPGFGKGKPVETLTFGSSAKEGEFYTEIGVSVQRSQATNRLISQTGFIVKGEEGKNPLIFLFKNPRTSTSTIKGKGTNILGERVTPNIIIEKKPVARLVDIQQAKIGEVITTTNEANPKVVMREYPVEILGPKFKPMNVNAEELSGIINLKEIPSVPLGKVSLSNRQVAEIIKTEEPKVTFSFVKVQDNPFTIGTFVGRETPFKRVFTATPISKVSPSELPKTFDEARPTGEVFSFKAQGTQIQKQVSKETPITPPSIPLKLTSARPSSLPIAKTIVSKASIIPTITSASASSIYAGKGTYELTTGGSLPSFQFPKPSITGAVIGIPSTQNRIVQDIIQPTKTAEIPSLIIKDITLQRQPQIENQISRQRQTQEQIVSQLQKQSQGQIQRTEQRITLRAEGIPREGFTFKNIPVFKPIGKTIAKDERYKKLLGKVQAYKTYLESKGKKYYLPGLRSLGEAELIGKTKVLSQVRFKTFGVEATKATVEVPEIRLPDLSQFREYKISKGKAIATPGRFIEKKGGKNPLEASRFGRLTTYAERSQLKALRKRSKFI